MGRKSEVRYWESRKAFCTTVRGKQHVLCECACDDSPTGPNYLEALTKYHELLQTQAAPTAGDGNNLRVIIEKYLEYLHREKSRSAKAENTFLQKQAMLNRFCFAPRHDGPGVYGDLLIADLKHHHANEFCEAMRKPRDIKKAGRICQWNSGTVRLCLSNLISCCEWAKSEGYISTNPFAKLKLPPIRSRGDDSLVSTELHERIMKLIRTNGFRLLVQVLEATGCRPGELSKATKANYDAREGVLRFASIGRLQEGEETHKTGRKGKERIIVLTGDALHIVKHLVEKHPNGPLFRRKDGKTAWTVRSISDAFYNLRKKLGKLTDERGRKINLSSYSYRHTFATNFLKKGGSVEVLASLMGNSPETIRQHYAHLLADVGNLRAHLEMFNRTMEAEQRTGKTSA